jgi:flagellar hook-basal body complex protein FliE
MGLLPINTTSVRPTGLHELGSLPGKTAVRPAADGDFSSTIRGLLEKANQPHLMADQALQQMASGETDNVHEVVMSVIKADMSFRFVLELRNRLTEAYQELMRMQV